MNNQCDWLFSIGCPVLTRYPIAVVGERESCTVTFMANIPARSSRGRWQWWRIADHGGGCGVWITDVAGSGFLNKRGVIHEYSTPTLMRNTLNRADPNAIEVLDDDHVHVGFVPKDLAFVLAPKMDAGIYNVHVSVMQPSPCVRIRVVVSRL